jgi:hypothetical protein
MHEGGIHDVNRTVSGTESQRFPPEKARRFANRPSTVGAAMIVLDIPKGPTEYVHIIMDPTVSTVSSPRYVTMKFATPYIPHVREAVCGYYPTASVRPGSYW